MNNHKTLTILLISSILLLALAGCSAGKGDSDDDSDIIVKPIPGGTGIKPDMQEHNRAFKSDRYSGSAQCNSCHNDLQDESENEVSIGNDWSTSMMANSTRDPYWIAKVAAEMARHPTLKEELDDTCSRCHAPMANDSIKKDAGSIEIHGDDGMLNENHVYFDHAMEGVSCTLCHQMEDTGTMGSIDGVSGKFSVKEYANKSERPAFAQYSDPSDAYMLAQSEFTATYSAHISTSESCATCHDLRTPSVDASGNVITTSEESFFPEQMVFSEWRNSDFQVGGSKEQTCQGCHMPQVTGTVNLATQGGGVPRQNFSRHTFLGANTVMQSMLKNYSAELGIDISAEAFDESISRNREFLKTAATVDIESSTVQGSELTTTVKVNNTTGHKLPSGYPSRRVFLHFVVTNDIGEVVFESGKEPGNGSVIGIDEDEDSSTFEKHYDTITSAEQVQVYEAIMQDSDSNVTHTLLRAVAYIKENRLLPSGFTKLSASDDIKVAGDAINDANFDAGGDTITYKVTLPAAGSYNIFVELKYQPLAFGHLLDLFKSDTVTIKEVDEFKTLFDKSALKSESIASATASVQ